MIFHKNRLPADDSHEIPCRIVIFEKAAKFEIYCRLLQIIGGTLWVILSSFIISGISGVTSNSNK